MLESRLVLYNWWVSLSLERVLSTSDDSAGKGAPGNRVKLTTEPTLRRVLSGFDSSAGSCPVGNTTQVWSNETSGKVGEVDVREARIDVEVNFSSGENVEELGGVGSARPLGTERPRPATGLSSVAPSMASSFPSAMKDGLGVLEGGPWNVGTKDMRTLFFRR
jgi:hypothetical protein